MLGWEVAMDTFIELAILAIDARQASLAYIHLRNALGEANKLKDHATKRDILAVMSKLRPLL